jgi:hypothetical protein
MLVAAVRGVRHHEGDALGSSATPVAGLVGPVKPRRRQLQRSGKEWAISRLAGTTLPLRSSYPTFDASDGPLPRPCQSCPSSLHGHKTATRG